MSTDAILQENMLDLYYQPSNPAAFGSVAALQNATSENRKTVQNFLEAQPTYTLHKQVRKRYPTRKYHSLGVDMQWQADLAEMQQIARQNKGMRYLLTVVDVFSRYAWVRPMKNKTSDSVIAAFTDIFKTDNRKPHSLQTDQGKEFENAKCRAFYKHHQIRQFSVKSQFKAALVERFNRTLKTKLYKYFTYKKTYHYLNVLQDFVYAYNHSVHRMTRAKPAEITKENEHEYRDVSAVKAKSKSDLQVGDAVRLSKVKRMFEKGYLPNWTSEVFLIHQVHNTNPLTFTIRDLNNEIIEGSFYRAELQKIRL